MIEQLEDTLECVICRKQVRVIMSGSGSLSCCNKMMQNVTYDRISNLKIELLKYKALQLMLLEALQRTMSESARYADDCRQIGSQIDQQREAVAMIANDVLHQGRAEPVLSKLLMEAIDDLYMSSLTRYPSYVAVAQRESHPSAVRLFNKAKMQARQAIETLESILYHVERES